MQHFLLKNKNYSNLSIFENNNFYNISFNDKINGWLKITSINNTINIYISLENINGYILFSNNIDNNINNNNNFENTYFKCNNVDGLFFNNNNYNKLLIEFHNNIKDLNDFENYLEYANFYLISTNDINEKQNINQSNLINFDKINKIKTENNKILNINDLILHSIKSMKFLKINYDKLISKDNFFIRYYELCKKIIS